MNSLELTNVSKSYDNLHVLQNISLQIHPGEFVSLIGPSGCGKSTLLRLIAGIDEPTGGEVAIDEKNIFARRGKMSYMPQKPSLLPWRTVEENVVLGMDIKKVSREKSLKQARTLLADFGLADFAGVYPSTLSGGMSQKIALLRTVLFSQKVLLLDESFGSLDALTRLSMQVWLLSLWKKYRSSVLFVTHDIREAILLSDSILVMSQRPGKIITDISVDLPRPRTREHLASKKAIHLEQKLLKLLVNE